MVNKLDILISHNEIEHKIIKLAKELEKKLSKNSNIIFIVVLKGVLIFLINLMRQIDPKYTINLEVIKVSSYKHKQSLELVIHNSFKQDLNNKDVIILEDIIDTGKTLEKLIAKLNNDYKLKSLELYSLATKKSVHKNFSYPYKALFSIPDVFIVGYGFDCNEYFRNLEDICVYGD